MADVLSIVSGVISVVTAIKDLVTLALEARNTFSRNKRSTQDLQDLSKEIISILDGIKKHAENTDPDLDTGDLDEMASLLTAFSTDIKVLCTRIGRLAQSPSLQSRIFSRRGTEVEDTIADIRKCFEERVRLFTLFSNIFSRRVVKNTERVVKNTERVVQRMDQGITALTVTTANIDRTTTTIATSVGGRSWSVPQDGSSQLGPSLHSISPINGMGVSEDLQIQLRRYLSRFPKASATLSMSIIGELYLGCQVDVALSLCERLKGKNFAELYIPLHPEDENAAPIRNREFMRRVALGQVSAIQEVLGQDSREYTVEEAIEANNCIKDLRRATLRLGLWDMSNALLVASIDIERKSLDMKSPASVSIFIDNLLVFADDSVSNISERVSALEEVRKLIQSADKATPNLDLMKAQYLVLCLEHPAIYQSEGTLSELLPVLDNFGVDMLRGSTTFGSSQESRRLYVSTRLALSLCKLGNFYMKVQQYQEAVKAYNFSLTIYEQDVEDWTTCSPNKAHVHFRLTDENLRSFLSDDSEDVVRHAKAAVDLTRTSYLADPQTWSRTQYDYLHRYGSILWGCRLHEQALLVWKEAEEIVDQHIPDELVFQSQFDIAILHRKRVEDLVESDRVDESVQVSRLSLKFFQMHIGKKDMLLRYIPAILQHSNLLQQQGLIGAALPFLDAAKGVLKTLSILSGQESIFNLYLDLFRSRTLRVLGRNIDSLRYAKGVLAGIGATQDSNGRWSRNESESKNTEAMDQLMLYALIEHQRALACIGEWEAALDAARNAVEVWFREDDSLSESTLDDCDESLYFLANSLSDTGMNSEALVYAQKASELASKKLSPGRQWRSPIQTYTFFTMKPDDTTIAEILDLHAKRVEKRPGLAPRYALILWSIGIFYCHHGMHEEGLSAAKELRGLRKKYDAVLFDVVEAIDVALKYEQSRPSWKGILDKIHLECGHQDV